MIIAIAGGAGSGKSEVSKVLKEFGFEVIIADEVNARLLKDEVYLEKLKSLFPSAFDTNGNLVKSSLRSIIFNDPYERQKLNNFSHPVILKEISALARKNSGVSFVEIPLLMESGAKWLFDKTILVLASDSLRAERVALRDSISLADAYAIIQAQHCEEEIEADAIIQNSSCVTALRQEIKTALALLEIEPQIK